MGKLFTLHSSTSFYNFLFYSYNCVCVFDGQFDDLKLNQLQEEFYNKVNLRKTRVVISSYY